MLNFVKGISSSGTIKVESAVEWGMWFCEFLQKKEQAHSQELMLLCNGRPMRLQ